MTQATNGASAHAKHTYFACLPSPRLLGHLMEQLQHFLFDLLIAPFWTYPFLKRAFLGCAALSLGCGTIGAFLVLRRMGLVADALSHGLFPGVSIAFLVAGFNIGPLSIGGAFTAVLLGLFANRMSQKKHLNKDSTFSILVFLSTAVALFILASFGGYTDVMHILLGNVLALSKTSLLWLGGTASFTLFSIATLYRPLVLLSFDPIFFKVSYKGYRWIDTFFLLLVALNTVCAFQALGSLLALGLLLIPAITARLLTRHIWTLCLLSSALALLSSTLGLLISFHAGYPTGPLIILIATTFYGLAYIQPGKNLKRLIGVTLLAGLVWGGSWIQKNAKQKPSIVVSFTVLEDFVYNIAGQHVTIKTLAGPDQDPHMFEPSPQDMAALSKADLVIINGLHLENHWLPGFLKEHRNKPVVVCTKGIKPLSIKVGRSFVPDPHAWHYVQHAKHYVSNIKNALISLLPGHKKKIEQNTKAYLARLNALEAWTTTQINSIPSAKRIAFTTHDGFGYLSKYYDIRLMAPLGLSTNDEPSSKKLAQLIHTAKRQKIKSIFLENMVSDKLSKTLAENADMSIGGTLYSDALSEKSGPAGTYIDMMRHNIQTLCQAFQ